MLAVLKAGAAYVPMDPAHPEERLDRTARDAGVRLVVRDTAPYLSAARTDRPRNLTPRNLTRGIPPTSSTPPVRPAVPRGSSSPTPMSSPSSTPPARTSPSPPPTPGRSSTPPPSTSSVWEIWGALLTGARLVVVDHWVARSPEDFHALLVRESVTVLAGPRAGLSGRCGWWTGARRKGCRCGWWCWVGRRWTPGRCSAGSTATRRTAAAWSTCTGSRRPPSTSPRRPSPGAMAPSAACRLGGRRAAAAGGGAARRGGAALPTAAVGGGWRRGASPSATWGGPS